MSEAVRALDVEHSLGEEVSLRRAVGGHARDDALGYRNGQIC